MARTPIVAELKGEVKDFLARSAMAPSLLGKTVANDSSFVARINKKNAVLNTSTVDKVRKFLDRENGKLDRKDARKKS